MNAKNDVKALCLGGGIGSLAAAAFMIGDGGVAGRNLSTLETKGFVGGAWMQPGIRSKAT